MSDNKLDITSTAVEKGIDLVKGFVEKLVGSTLEETGLLLGDKIRLFRLNNQIKMLNKAQQICNENNIPMKQISVKTLFPLLEYASIEEDETLQNCWSNLLVNYIDVNQKLESSIFPFILSQISSDELKVIDLLYHTKTLSSLLQRSYIDEILKSNLIRLGIAELIIIADKRKLSRIARKPLLGQSRSREIRITSLGVKFYESCSRSEAK